MNPSELLSKAIGDRVAITPAQIMQAQGKIQTTDANLTNGWMGPGAPLEAQQPQVAGRQWDFPVGFNLQYTPRGTEKASFSQLRALADNYDIVRLLIETRKDQLVKIKWNVQNEDLKKKTANDPRIKVVEDFFKMPDKRQPWQSWIRALLEDLLVIDAPVIYPRMTKGGQLYSLELMDGATIKPIIDQAGRKPLPPYPAYMQTIKGVPAVTYDTNQLIYVPKNGRTNVAYGLSPVEQIMITINIGIRRQMHQLQNYTDGSTPDLILSTPSDWNPAQTKEFQEWWNSALSGNTAERRKTRFIPGGISVINTKENVLKDEYDEWLARVCCFAFSCSPTPFIKAVNRATAETAQEAALSEGLIPLMQWVKDLIDSIIWKYFGFTDLTFSWEQETDLDPAIRSTIINTDVRNGTMTINEGRAMRGQDPVEGGDIAMIYTAGGAVPVISVETQLAPVAEPMSQTTSTEKLAKGTKSTANQKKNFAATQTYITNLLKEKSKEVANEISLAPEAKYLDRLDQMSFNWSDAAAEIAPFLNKAYEDSGVTAIVQVGKEETDLFNVVNQEAVAYAAERAAELVGMKYVDGELVPNPDAKWQITEPTRDMIRDTVNQAEKEGWSTKQLADAIQENYAFSDARAETIARTELSKADNQGSIAGWKASGVVPKIEWVASPTCCEECQEYSGEIADIDDGFPDGNPPLHPNCTCGMAPVTENEEADKETEED